MSSPIDPSIQIAAHDDLVRGHGGAVEPEAIMVLTDDSEPLWVKTRRDTIHGWPVERVLGVVPMDLVHPDDRIVARRANLWCLKSGDTQTIHVRVRSATGRWVWTECTYQRIDWEGQQATEVTLWDVSEMSMSYESLGLVVGILRKIDLAPDLCGALQEAAVRVMRFLRLDRGYVWQIDDDDRVVAAEWVGDISSAPRLPDAAAEEELRLLFEDRPHWSIKTDRTSRDGRVAEEVQTLWLPVVAGSNVIAVLEYESWDRITEGNAELAASVFSRLADALDRKDVEDKLDLARQQLSAAFNDAPIGMALVTPTGLFDRVNQALASLFERDADEMDARRVVDLIHPHDRGPAIEAFDQLLAGTTDRFQLEIRLLRADESSVWTLLSAAAASDREGEVLQFIVQVTDISAQKAREFQLSGQSDPDADPIEALDTYLQAQPADASVSLISILLGTGDPSETDRIQAVGRRLRSHIRNNDFFAQPAPDRFVVVASGLPDDGGSLIETIRQRFEDSVVSVDPDLKQVVTAELFDPSVRARDILGELDGNG